MRLLLIIACLLPIGCEKGFADKHIREKAYQDGKIAYSNGVPSTANPYNSSGRTDWLNGWIEQKKSGE